MKTYKAEYNSQNEDVIGHKVRCTDNINQIIKHTMTLDASSTVADVFAPQSLSTSVLCCRNCANTNAIHV